MAKCNFSIDFSSEPEVLISNIKNALSNAGGNLNGDISAGTFSLSTPIGHVKGNYRISGQAIIIEITDKPLLVSCNRIEEELRKRLS